MSVLMNMHPGLNGKFTNIFIYGHLIKFKTFFLKVYKSSGANANQEIS